MAESNSELNFDAEAFVKSSDLSAGNVRKLKKAELRIVAEYLDLELSPEARKDEYVRSICESLELKVVISPEENERYRLDLEYKKAEKEREMQWEKKKGIDKRKKKKGKCTCNCNEKRKKKIDKCSRKKKIGIDKCSLSYRFNSKS